MSVPSTTGRNEFNFNGSLTSFTFDFPIIETSDLLVIVCLIATGVETPLTEGTDYEVTSALGDFSSGGIVSMIEYIDEVKTPKAWPATYKLILLRDVPATQGVDFTENMATLYENFERGLDKLTMLVQQLLEAQDRTLTVPRSEASTLSRELPPAVDRKNMLLGFDANGKPCVALQTGEQGPQGVQGIQGPAGADGTDGTDGVGVPAGGTDGQILAKASNDDYDTEWVDAATGGSGGLLEFSNLNFTATVDSKALTIAIKGVDGNDPSAGNKVIVPFRSATLTSGVISDVEITSALSMVLSSGSTLGFTAGETGRIYWGLINNAGTAEVVISRRATGFKESALVSTTAEGGAGAADDPDTLYSSTARSNVPCRLCGFIEIQTGATAGEWDNAPTKVQVMGPGVRRTGDIIQVVQGGSSAYAVTSTQIPSDDTLPQNTEGGEAFTQAVTFSSAINKAYIDIVTHLSASGVCVVTTALFQDTGADALSTGALFVTGNTWGGEIIIKHQMITGTISETTFKVRFGPGSAVNAYLNGWSGSRRYCGSLYSSITITEVFA